jgi:hypothetical protein
MLTKGRIKRQKTTRRPRDVFSFPDQTNTANLLSNVIADASIYKPKDYPVKKQYNVLDFHKLV